MIEILVGGAFFLGFIVGTDGTYLLVRAVKRELLDLKRTYVTAEDIRNWRSKEREIESLRNASREMLDKISGHA